MVKPFFSFRILYIYGAKLQGTCAWSMLIVPALVHTYDAATTPKIEDKESGDCFIHK